MMISQPLPAWHDTAQCSGTSTPQAWDSDGERSWRLLVAGFEACHGCPVVRECARAALAERPTGVVHAGVALPAYPWWGDIASQYRSALEEVAETGAPAPAIARHLATSPQYLPAVAALAARGVLPDDLPPHVPAEVSPHV